MNAEDRVHELWFAGAHSDVGGGYYFDGLADTTLRYMLDWIGDLEWDVKLISPDKIPLEDIIDSGNTIASVLALLETRGPKSLRVCALLDKSERRETEIPIHYCDK